MSETDWNKCFEDPQWAASEIDRLTAEVEKWKSIAQQINTDWIPANQALAEEVERLKELVCSTTLQRNEYFVRAEQAEKERDNWVESARMFCSNEEYYRGLCDKALNSIGDESYICDDGSRSEDPLRAKLPELVDKLVWNEALLIKERDRYRQALEKILGPMGHDDGLTQQIAREALEG